MCSDSITSRASAPLEITATDVNSRAKLAHVPDRFRSEDPARPLLYVDAAGDAFRYALNPVRHCVLLILVVEGLERFAYYGLANSQLEYLTGQFDPDWNAGMTSVAAANVVSSSTALAALAPLLGGVLADGLLGDYWNIVVGTAGFYVPGLVLVALCSYPHALGAEFDRRALYAGMLVLWPLGTGLIKSTVNVFGAKQFHPALQSDLVERYYVSFYGAINLGALLGGITIPLMAQVNISVAYTIPAVALCLGLMAFLLGSRRYIKRKPEKKALWTSLAVVAAPLRCQSLESQKASRGGAIDDDFVDGTRRLLMVFPATCLIFPMMIAYNQMTTVFITQGEAMRNAGFIDPSMMSNFDSISVLLNSALYQYLVVPALARRNVHPKTTTKFAVGIGFGALAIAVAIAIDYRIHAELRKENQVNILWQAIPYFLVGAGEILTMALSYDVAFKIAPKEQKGLASGINIFVMGCLSNLDCLALQQSCASFFPDDAANPTDYMNSQLSNYLWILFAISVCGIIVNLLPPVSNWLERLMESNGNARKVPAISGSLSEALM